MSSQRSPTKGPLPKHSKSPTQISNPPPKSPLKPLPSPLKGSITSLYAEHDLWSFKILDEPVPKGSKEPDPEYHANPDEISLGSSEDAEQAGPDPQLLIEEIHDYIGPVLHPDATSSPTNAIPPKRGRKPWQAAANTSNKSETKTTSSASGVKKVGTSSSSNGAKKVERYRTETKRQRKVTFTLDTVRNTRSKRKEAEFEFDALDALLNKGRKRRMGRWAEEGNRGS